MAGLKYFDPGTGTYKDVYGPPGPAGPAGSTGPTGPKGDKGDPGTGGDGGSEVLIDPAQPTVVNGLPELWIDTDDDTGGIPSLVSGTWGTAPLDAATYGPDSLRGLEIYVDSAAQLRARPQIIAGSRYITDSPAVYPIGMSIFALSAVDSVTFGWPASCTVVTFRRSSGDTVCAQYYYQNHTPQSSPPLAMYRAGNGANSPQMWSAWTTVGSPADTGWTNVVYGTDWDDYGPGYQTGQYRKIGNEVRLRGLVKTAVVRTATSTVFSLPVGFRPLASEVFNGTALSNVITGAASTGTAHTHTAAYQIPIRIDVVASTGAVAVIAQAGQNLAVSSWVSLSGLAFYVD